ncbi:hypothetical protein GCM10029992_38940 [Glycomyces albus]
MLGHEHAATQLGAVHPVDGNVSEARSGVVVPAEAVEDLGHVVGVGGGDGEQVSGFDGEPGVGVVEVGAGARSPPRLLGASASGTVRRLQTLPEAMRPSMTR